MKVIILAGGKGTRISEYTKTIPKPMIKIEQETYFITYYQSLFQIRNKRIFHSFRIQK